MKEAVAAILKESFTPSETTGLWQRCIKEEQVNSETIESLLDVSWKRVEEIIARNKRRRCVIEEELPQTLAEVDTYRFWTPDMAAARFHFPRPEDFGLRTIDTVGASGEAGTDVPPADTIEQASHDMNSSNALLGDSSSLVLQPTPPTTFTPLAAAAGATDPAVPGKHRAHAWGRTDKELLDPTKLPNPLRRLFAPILQRRHELPKTLTLLLNAVQRVQSEGFPVIEALIEKGYFHMPLHRSFRHISSFIARYLAENSRGEAREREFAENYKPAAFRFEEAREKVREMGSNQAAAASKCEKTVEIVYTTLLTELRERKALQHDCDSALQGITDNTNLQLDGMEKGLQECDNESFRLLGDLERDVRAYLEKLKEAIERTKAARKEIYNEYQRDHDRLHSSLHGKLYQLKKSEDMQEKLARRIREATKEWHMEQLKYENLMQEVIAETLALRQLDCSHNQLEALLDERLPTADSERKLRWVTDSLQQSEELRSELIAQCRQHIERLKKDEYYRRCRMVGYATENALRWSRCLQDLSALYEGHYDTVAVKSNTSMQLRYLLAYEKDLVIKDLHQLQREFSLLETSWAKLTSLLEELELPVPPLAECEKDVSCGEFRRTISELVGGRLICGDFARLLPIRREGRSSPIAGKRDGAAAGAGG
ncbi:hypothetical protein MOQ_003765 [Trypanosoma cruzi marinkellei]|uniref:Paraflagellar rod protein n=1 Tax=Trypanosoma cruzi marinkellei TaxID=85056 RepID=K2MZ71_TRYCR|nr:hypothetical protein MOQ_003765 [Trypanosoma cruzi marinkellei]